MTVFRKNPSNKIKPNGVKKFNQAKARKRYSKPMKQHGAREMERRMRQGADINQRNCHNKKIYISWNDIVITPVRPFHIFGDVV